MINLIRVIAGVALAAMPCAVMGQSLTESVTVEGRYTPDILPADRLSLLPTIITLEAP